MRWSRTTFAIIGVLALVGALAGVFGAPSASSQALTLRAFAVAEQPAVDPTSALWQSIQGVAVPLTAQAVTYPNGGGTVPSVTLKAVHYDNVLYVRASWPDQTKDYMPWGVTSFTDAAALEFPAKSAVAVPSFCMGQVNASVNIWQWRADTPARGSDTPGAWMSASANADSMPAAVTQDPVFQPAEALGNPVATPDLAVQNLVAQAFGTLTFAPVQTVEGQGAWDRREWAVVFARPFAGNDPSQADFAVGTPTNMAVAVWNGGAGDRGGQKSVSSFVTLDISPTALKPAESRNGSDVLLGMALSVGAVLAGIALAMLLVTWVLRSARSAQGGV
jgi:complex iron-sulfur molybdoenzyme family reductase subunit gamma